jgi:hypothetical protein
VFLYCGEQFKFHVQTKHALKCNVLRFNVKFLACPGQLIRIILYSTKAATIK